MASESLLTTGDEDHNTCLSPSEPTISAAPAPEDVPSRTASPSTPTTSLSTLPISELVLDSDTVLQPLPFGSLHDSKHNPDFRGRNYAKSIKMSAIMSDFHTLLQAASRSEDQSAFDSLHAKLSKAGEGLESLAQDPLVAHADEDSEFKNEDLGLGRIVPSNLEGDWYMVQHGSLEGDGAEDDASITKRLQCARKAYEAALDDQGSSDSDSDGGAPIFEEQHSEDEDATLVEDSPEDFALLDTTSSLTLDGSHAQAAPDSMVTDYCRPEVLHRAADFLENIQRCNKDIMNTYGVTLDDLEIAEDETSASEATEDLGFESVGSIIEAVETLKCANEVIMAAYGLSVGDLDVELDESEEAMKE
jgi:hypothetical protein